MSGCGGGCSCGSDCKCGSGCKCGRYPDLESTTTFTIIEGVAPMKNYGKVEGSAEKATEGGNACKCGANCKCDPCNC